MAAIRVHVGLLMMLFGLVVAVGLSRATDSQQSTSVADAPDILIIILSQPNRHHEIQAEQLRENIDAQAASLNMRSLTVELTHQRWPGIGAWTIQPILTELSRMYREKKWVFFCDEGTFVHLDQLIDIVRKYDPSKELFIGRGLRDKEATIIHHFAFHENPSTFVYPDLYAGFLFSMTLVKSLVEAISIRNPLSDFAIDAMHELALFIKDVRNGLTMVEDEAFCAGDEHGHCATAFPNHAPICGDPVPEGDVFFAVKTCSKFHTDRVPVIQKTWGRDAQHLVFYSDTADSTIPTVSAGVPNTERGHCGKTFAILKRFHKDRELQHFLWLVITDDDTLLSVVRLRRLLACYDNNEPVALGERYGYAVMTDYGYTYITGGGGMVLNRLAVHVIMESGVCACGSNDAPDDMTLGMCLKRLDIPATHSPLFHQARPTDYSVDLLRHQRPVSFHKFWMINPLTVYKEWFGQKQERDEL